MNQLKNFNEASAELKKAFLISKKQKIRKTKKLKAMADAIEKKQAKLECIFAESSKLV